MFDVVLKNGRIVTPTGLIEGDVGIKDGKILKIGYLTEAAKSEKNCEGLFVMPGAIDMHVHFRDPGFTHKEDFFTGSCAAAAGGITTVIDMPNTAPPTTTRKALEEKRKIALSKSIVNFGFYMALTGDNLDEIAKAENIAGVKIYLGSTTGNLLLQDSSAIEKFFKLEKFAIIHAEDEEVIREHAKKYPAGGDPSVHSLIHCPEAALKAAKAILHLAKKCDAKIHITHVSTAAEVSEIAKFKSPSVSADCTPHHLFLDQTAYAKQGNFAKVNPPLRADSDRRALLDGLKTGVIQAVASDHAPHTKDEKELPYEKAPAGVPGVETLLPLLLDAVNHGEFTLSQVAKFTAENPAKLLSIKSKGRLEEGADADIIVVDMEKEMKVGRRKYFSKCGWSPFEGRNLKGWPVLTLVNGRAVFEDGKINGENKSGEVRFDFFQRPN